MSFLHSKHLPVFLALTLALTPFPSRADSQPDGPFGVFWPASPPYWNDTPSKGQDDGEVVGLTCSQDGKLDRPGHLFSTLGHFCGRASGREIAVGGNLNPRLIHDLELDAAGTVWAATYRGLYHSSAKGLWQRVEALGEGDIRAVRASGSRMLVGTRGGQLFLAEDGQGWRRLKVPDSGRIRSLDVDGSGRWLVAAGSVVLRLAADGSSWPKVSGGLPESEVLSLLWMVDRIAVRTASGFFVWRETGGGWKPENVPELEGWHRFEGSGVQLDFPTFGQPTSSDLREVRNFSSLGMEAVGDGFFKWERDQLYFGVFSEREQTKLTRELVARDCESPPRPLPGHEGAFQCRPTVEGESISDLMWIFERGDQPLLMVTLYTGHIDPGIPIRMRNSLRLLPNAIRRGMNP